MVYIGTSVPRYLCRRSTYEKLQRSGCRFQSLALLHFHQARGWAHCCRHYPLQCLCCHSSYISAAAAETNPWFRTDLFKSGHWKRIPCICHAREATVVHGDHEVVGAQVLQPFRALGHRWVTHWLPDSQLQFLWLLVTEILHWRLFCSLHCSNAPFDIRR